MCTPFTSLPYHVYPPPPTLGSPSPSEAGSDTVHTDLDDQHSSVSKPHRESRKNSNNSNSSLIAAGHSMPPYEELTPIYVIKNLVVKPVRYTVITYTLRLAVSGILLCCIMNRG